MALTNYERQKRWREKNRVIYNLRRRNARKNLIGVGITEQAVTETSTVQLVGNGCPAPAQSSTIEKLRAMVADVKAEPKEPKPTIFRDDNGRQITEHQWNILHEKKRQAKEGGYVLDDYIQ